jgi:NitT/TauT family transport system permease protein
MKRTTHHLHHAQHHLMISNPVSLSQRMLTFVLGPLAFVALIFLLTQLFPFFPTPSVEDSSFGVIVSATIATCTRLVIAYVLAVVCAVPLAILVTLNRTAEAILLPVFDILQSVPILALFPIIIALFINFNLLNGAAIFILFLSMMWNIVFTLIGGLQLIPHDIEHVARVFGIRGFSYVRRILIPALVPQLVTGSIVAVSAGWNLIIVAEVLHTYIPGGTAAQDLFGIGSILVTAAAHAQHVVFAESVLVIVVIIGVFNFLVWQKLLLYSQRFRFE